MIIGVTEGERYRFEVLLMSDGYIVRPRAIGSDKTLETRERMFRTASQAFDFAQMSAQQDTENTSSALLDVTEASNSDGNVRGIQQLAESSVSAAEMAAWSRQSSSKRRMGLH